MKATAWRGRRSSRSPPSSARSCRLGRRANGREQHVAIDRLGEEVAGAELARRRGAPRCRATRPPRPRAARGPGPEPPIASARAHPQSVWSPACLSTRLRRSPHHPPRANRRPRHGHSCARASSAAPHAVTSFALHAAQLCFRTPESGLSSHSPRRTALPPSPTLPTQPLRLRSPSPKTAFVLSYAPPSPRRRRTGSRPRRAGSRRRSSSRSERRSGRDCGAL